MLNDARLRITRELLRATPIAPLVYFRVAFGLIMLWECGRYVAYGWVTKDYINPDFHFHYFGFSWVHPWSGIGMAVHFWVMGLLALLMAVGLFYRVASTLFFLTFTHVFLIDQAYYLNHFYLISLVSFLLIFLPANQALSFDALRHPEIKSNQMPTWVLWLLRFQIGVPYFFGGIAKLSSVDWLRGQAMNSMLDYHFSNPTIQKWVTSSAGITFLTWSGLNFDLLIIPALLWRPTRVFALVAAMSFHLFNAVIFDIGIFPWFMMVSTLVLFQPNLFWLERRFPRGGGPFVVPDRKGQRVILTALSLYALAQVLIPFRHLLYPGSVSWTEEGHILSWRMKLRSKDGFATFHAVTEDGKKLAEADLIPRLPPDQMVRMEFRLQRVPPDLQPLGRHLYLSDVQRERMEGRPELIRQYAQFLSCEFKRYGFGKVSVYATAWVSLNDRKRQLIVNPKVDLAAEPESLWHASWITSFKE